MANPRRATAAFTAGQVLRHDGLVRPVTDLRILWRVLGTSLAGLHGLQARSLFGHPWATPALSHRRPPRFIHRPAVGRAQRKAVELTAMLGRDDPLRHRGVIFTHAWASAS